VAGICNSVSGSVFLTYHRGGGAGGQYLSVSRLGLLIGNRWMSRLQDRAACHGMRKLLNARHGRGALSETVATVSLSTVPRLSLLSGQSCRLRVGKWTFEGGGGRVVSLCRRPIFRAFTQGSNDAAEVRGSFQETAPRKTAENTVKHRDGS